LVAASGPSSAQRHDAHAIRVDRGGVPMGYVRTTDAMQLSPVLDQFGASVALDCSITCKETAATKSVGVSFSTSVSSPSIAGARNVQNHLKAGLRGFVAADLSSVARTNQSHQQAPQSSAAAAASAGETAAADFVEGEVMRQLLQSASMELSEHDWLQQKDALDEMFDEQARSQIANLPQYPMPALLVRSGHGNNRSVQLFKHQVDGIRWLIHQEQQDLPSYFEREVVHGRTHWRCKITRARYPEKPAGMKGGMLCDDMGLVRTGHLYMATIGFPVFLVQLRASASISHVNNNPLRLLTRRARRCRRWG
jgi:hypothetical protein